MYASIHFSSKKALKDAVKAGEVVTVFQPNGDLFGATPPTHGKVTLEGPHFPQPHRWYAEATLKDGRIVSVK
jgi:hypothetical protein